MPDARHYLADILGVIEALRQLWRLVVLVHSISEGECRFIEIVHLFDNRLAAIRIHRVGARSQHLESGEKVEFPRPHTLHRPAFLWSNRSEVWGSTSSTSRKSAGPYPVTLD